MLTVERSDEGVSAQCEKLADISDFTFDYDLIDGPSAMGQVAKLPPFHGRLIKMARHRRRHEVRAGKCVARRVHYHNCQRTFTCSSRFRAVLIEAR